MSKLDDIKKLDLNNIRFVTSDTSLTENDSYLICDAPIEMYITLPSASGSRKLYLIKNLSIDTVYINATGSDMIDNIDNYWWLYTFESVTLVDYSVGNWIILDANIWWIFWFGDGV